MTKSQKLQLRLSEIRQKLNELSALDEATDEQRAEMDTLSTEFAAKETEWRAAVIAEADELETRQAEADAGANGDGETAEVRALLGKASLSGYLAHAATGTVLDGEEAELNAALEVRGSAGTAIPWALLETPDLRAGPARGGAELRADVATTSTALGGPEMQRPILQRLFGRDILAALGVRLDSVPSGVSEWPLLTGGGAPFTRAEGAARPDAAAAVFDTQTLKPKRLTGSYVYTVEQAAQVAMLEPALRRDLADSVRSAMSNAAINGDGNGPNVTGLLARIGVPGDAAAQATFADYAGVHALAVDGIHAVNETEVSSVVGVASYRHAATVYQQGSGESGAEALRRRSAMCQASSFIPAADGNGQQKGNILHAGSDPMRGDSIAAVWPALEVIRDIYTKAGEGEVVLTWITLWDAYMAFRPGAYQRVAFKLTA